MRTGRAAIAVVAWFGLALLVVANGRFTARFSSAAASRTQRLHHNPGESV
ncbi:MAG: hypothetical protein ACLQMO_01190 [Acidobacteriaceae bacterium]